MFLLCTVGVLIMSRELPTYLYVTLRAVELKKEIFNICQVDFKFLFEWTDFILEIHINFQVII
jgi:hypothetical protein